MTQHLTSMPAQDWLNQSPVRLLSCPDQICHDVILKNDTLYVQESKGSKQTIWQLTLYNDQLTLVWQGPSAKQPSTAELLAAIEASLSFYPLQDNIILSISFQPSVELFNSGVLVFDKANQIAVHTEMFWQQARMWRLSAIERGFPIHYVFTGERRHPMRPPKPEGIVYRRYIPWLNQTLIFRTIEIVGDLECFHRWMNDPIVAQFWQETGDVAKHRAYLESIAADSHTTSLIGSLDEEPFGYFEIYWAKENRIAPFYDVDDFDRGWHVLIGEAHLRGKPYVTAWMPSISHYLFLDDIRTRRIVIEPRSDNFKMVRSLTQCGYATLKEFDFPHKRAALGMLLRERFFSERLWVPRTNPNGASSSFSLSQGICYENL